MHIIVNPVTRDLPKGGGGGGDKIWLLKTGDCLRQVFIWSLIWFRASQKSVTPLNPIALRKAKIVCNFGLSECNKVKTGLIVVFHIVSK